MTVATLILSMYLIWPVLMFGKLFWHPEAAARETRIWYSMYTVLTTSYTRPNLVVAQTMLAETAVVEILTVLAYGAAISIGCGPTGDRVQLLILWQPCSSTVCHKEDTDLADLSTAAGATACAELHSEG